VCSAWRSADCFERLAAAGKERRSLGSKASTTSISTDLYLGRIILEPWGVRVRAFSPPVLPVAWTTLLHDLLKLLALLRGQHLANLVLCRLKLSSDLWGTLFPISACSSLAFLDDGFNLLALLLREIQFLPGASNEIHPKGLFWAKTLTRLVGS